MKLIIFIATLFLLALFGEININLKNLFDNSTIDYQIFWQIRIPKTLLAFLVGGILSVSGLIFQTVFRNTLATPYTLGVASGATLFSAIAIILQINSIFLFSFLGAIFTIIILFVISHNFKVYKTSSLLLIGIALSFLYNAILMFIFYISNLSQSYRIVRFTIGTLDVVGYKEVIILFLTTFALLFILFKLKKEIKYLSVSYEFALFKKIDVKKINFILLFTISFSVGIVVSLVGPIGFIGLIIPHIIKRVYKLTIDKLIIKSFLHGGIFLVFCDFITRNIPPYNLPIGIITSLFGATFFIYLLIKRD